MLILQLLVRFKQSICSYNENIVLDFLNKQHPNIKFTIEKEVKNSLPFLDTRVIKNVDKYVTTIYHKKNIH